MHVQHRGVMQAGDSIRAAHERACTAFARARSIVYVLTVLLCKRAPVCGRVWECACVCVPVLLVWVQL